MFKFIIVISIINKNNRNLEGTRDIKLQNTISNSIYIL
jgi:hypothetical protein